MAIAHFYWREWTRPQTTEELARGVAARARAEGILFLTAKFIRFPSSSVIASGVSKQEILNYWMPFICYLVMTIGGGIVGLWGDHERIHILQTIGAVFFGVGFVGGGLFLLSILIVIIQYSWWLRGLVARCSDAS